MSGLREAVAEARKLEKQFKAVLKVAGAAEEIQKAYAELDVVRKQKAEIALEVAEAKDEVKVAKAEVAALAKKKKDYEAKCAQAAQTAKEAYEAALERGQVALDERKANVVAECHVLSQAAKKEVAAAKKQVKELEARAEKAAAQFNAAEDALRDFKAKL